MRIKTIAEAKKLWEAFDKRYENMIFVDGKLTETEFETRKAIYNRREISTSFNQHVQSIGEVKANSAATTIQGFWFWSQRKDTLISVNAKGNHSKEFIHFLHEQKVKKSINQIKLKALYNAILAANFEHAIFKDPTLSQLALTLYDSKLISQRQLFTVLKFKNTVDDYQFIKAIKMINDKGLFTEECKQMLSIILGYNDRFKELSNEQYEELRLLILALPKSEQQLYVTAANASIVTEGQLKSNLVKLGSLVQHDDKFLHVTCGVHDAIGITRFAIDRHVRIMLRLGAEDKDDINFGVVNRVRYAAVGFPGTHPYGVIHGSNASNLVATSHDIYHSLIASSIPKPHFDILHKFVSLTRTAFNVQWSKEIWDWIDCDYLYYFKNRKYQHIDQDNIQQMTEQFCEMLSWGVGNDTYDVTNGGYLLRGQCITAIGINVFLDMLKNPSEWMEYKLNPVYLTGLYRSLYQSIQEIYLLIEHDPVKIQLFKCYAYLSLPNNNNTSKDEFDSINDSINDYAERIIGRLSFEKQKKIINEKETYDCNLHANTIYLALDGVPVNIATIQHCINHLNGSQSEKLIEFGKEDKTTAAILNAHTLCIRIFIECEGKSIKDIQAIQCAEFLQYQSKLNVGRWKELIKSGMSFHYIASYVKAISNADTLLISDYYNKLLLLIGCGVLLEVFSKLDNKIKIGFLQNASGVSKLMLGGLSLNSILAYDDASRDEIFKWGSEIQYLIEAGFALSKLWVLPVSLRFELYEHIKAVLLLAEAGLFPDQYANLNFAMRCELYKNTPYVAILTKAGLTLNELVKLNLEIRLSAYFNTFSISALVNQDIAIQKILLLDETLLLEVFEHGCSIGELIKRGISFDVFVALDREMRKTLINYSLWAFSLLNIGITIPSLLTLRPDTIMAGFAIYTLHKAGLSPEALSYVLELSKDELQEMRILAPNIAVEKLNAQVSGSHSKDGTNYTISSAF